MKNETERSVELLACNKNYGRYNFGALNLYRILNQPFVKETDTFRIYMTTKDDTSFENSFIVLDKDFIVPESQ